MQTAEEYTSFAVQLMAPQEKNLNVCESKNLDVPKNTKQLLHTKEVLMQSQTRITKMQVQ